MTPAITTIIALLLIAFIAWRLLKKPVNSGPLPDLLKNTLLQKVSFYQSLDQSARSVFEQRMQRFLETVRITGVKTVVSEEDRALVAASAIIPIFSFPNWEYGNLDEVLLYPDSFSEGFELQQEAERPVLGMVGDGAMQRLMILSQPSLRQGFSPQAGKSNTGIHEFVHLLDKSDGAVDGVPENLLDKSYILPWINLMHKTIKEINTGHSDINTYGATNQAEFFAVVSEYFFERPDLLQAKHPELYTMLEKIFLR